MPQADWRCNSFMQDDRRRITLELRNPLAFGPVTPQL
jgi:hypothetical protein